MSILDNAHMPVRARIRWLCHLLELYRLAGEEKQPNYAALKQQLKAANLEHARNRSGS